MRSIEINLASRPFRNDTPVMVGLVLLVTVTLGLTAYNSYTYMTADSRLERLDQQLTDHQAKMRQFQAEAKRLREELQNVDMATLEPQAQFVNGVLRERNFSWTRLFNAFEEVLPWNVRLLSVRPAFEGADVKIEIDGVAMDHEAYLGLQTALHRSPFFDKVVPGGFEAEAGNASRVFFNMSFRYLQAEPEPAPPDGQAAEGAEAAGGTTDPEPNGGQAGGDEDQPPAETAGRRGDAAGKGGVS